MAAHILKVLTRWWRCSSLGLGRPLLVCLQSYRPDLLQCVQQCLTLTVCPQQDKAQKDVPHACWVQSCTLVLLQA